MIAGVYTERHNDTSSFILNIIPNSKNHMQFPNVALLNKCFAQLRHHISWVAVATATDCSKFKGITGWDEIR